MTILEKYLYKEILSKVGWAMIFIGLILASDKFVDYLADAAMGDLPNGLIFNLLTIKVISLFPRILLVALFLGVMLALLRMSQDRELTVISGAGVSEYLKIISILKLSFLLSIVMFACSFFLSPWAEQKIREISDQAVIESDITGISSGKFNEFKKGNAIVYVENMDSKKEYLENIFLQVRQNEELGILAASDARFITKLDTGARYVMFEDGTRYVGQPGDRIYQITRYKSYAILLKTGEETPIERKIESFSTAELWGDPRPQHIAELQWRMSFIIAVLLLPLFALCINRFTGVDSYYVPIFICILTYLIYSNLLGVSRTMLEWGEIPAYLGLWWVHLGLLFIIILLIGFPSLKRRLCSSQTEYVG